MYPHAVRTVVPTGRIRQQSPAIRLSFGTFAHCLRLIDIDLGSVKELPAPQTRFHRSLFIPDIDRLRPSERMLNEIEGETRYERVIR